MDNIGKINSIIARDEAGQGEFLPRPLKSIASLFPLPFIIYALSFGNELAYRGSFIAWLFYSNINIVALKYVRKKSSRTFLVISGLLIVNLTWSSSLNAIFASKVNYDAAIKAIILINTLYIFDLMRHYSFASVMTALSPLSIALLLISVLHLLISPSIVYGRFEYFGMQPNLGGEMLLASCAIISAGSYRKFLPILGGISLYGCFLLQSRSAILAIAALLTISAARSFKPTRSKILIACVITLVIALAAFASLMSGALISTMEQMIHFIESSVLLVDNPERGFNSGLSGRDKTWVVAFEAFSSSPIFGVGLDQAERTVDGTRIHTGPLVILAEFGVSGFIFLFFLASALLRTLRQDIRHFGLIFSCLAAFLFQARGLNLNIFPMIMWIAALPWSCKKIKG